MTKARELQTAASFAVLMYSTQIKKKKNLFQRIFSALPQNQFLHWKKWGPQKTTPFLQMFTSLGSQPPKNFKAAVLLVCHNVKIEEPGGTIKENLKSLTFIPVWVFVWIRADLMLK